MGKTVDVRGLGILLVVLFGAAFACGDWTPYDDVNLRCTYNLDEVPSIIFCDGTTLDSNASIAAAINNLSLVWDNITWINRNQTDQWGYINANTGDIITISNDLIYIYGNISVLQANVSDIRDLIAGIPTGKWIEDSAGDIVPLVDRDLNVSDIHARGDIDAVNTVLSGDLEVNGDDIGTDGVLRISPDEELYLKPNGKAGLKVWSRDASFAGLKKTNQVVVEQELNHTVNFLVSGVGDLSNDDGWFRFLSGTGGVVVYWMPNNNYSRRMYLYAAASDAGLGGLRYGAGAEGDRSLGPVADNAYDAATASTCYKGVYYYTLHDCGSPTERLNGKKALPLIKQLAKGHKGSGEDVGGYRSDGYDLAAVGQSTKLTRIDYYYEQMPLEFQGENGSCGHPVTITDEVINALVLAVDELDEATGELGYCTTDEGGLRVRLLDAEDRVSELERVLNNLLTLLVSLGILGSGAVAYKYKRESN